LRHPVDATVDASEAGDVGLITHDAMVVQRSLAFTVTHVLCNACTVRRHHFSGYIDRIAIFSCTMKRIEMKNLASYHH